MLGAALASARIHLSGELPELQQDLQERICLRNRVAAELDVPLVSNHLGQILFLWVEIAGPEAKGGGHIGWKVFDPDGLTVLTRGRVARGVASRWGSPTAFAKPDGSFEILYDGEGPDSDDQ